MPIERVIPGAYTINELALGTDAKGSYISLVCARATAYVLCFSAGDPVRAEQLQLSENDLFRLHEGESLTRGHFRLQGVRKQAFEAMPVFRDFKVSPPEQIQVWSMAIRASGDVVLYVPEPGEQTCYVPLRYTYLFTPGGVRRSGDDPVGYLTVELKDEGQYADGALLYQVGESLPVPIPASLLGTPIPLCVEEGRPVHVVVDERFTGKYEKA